MILNYVHTLYTYYDTASRLPVRDRQCTSTSALSAELGTQDDVATSGLSPFRLSNAENLKNKEMKIKISLYLLRYLRLSPSLFRAEESR